MGMPAARLFIDKALGFPHCHVPGHPPGPPIPTPIIGLLLYPDPLDLIFGRPTVFINGLPAAEVGDPGIHAFCCGPNKFEISTGSSTVNIEGGRAARTFDFTKHCEAGMPVIPPVIGNRGTLVSGSPNVLIGGFPLPDFTAMAFAMGFKGLSKLKNLAKTGKLGKKIQMGLKKTSDNIHKTVSKITRRLPDRIRNMVHSSICTLTGHPVDVATGKVMVFVTDFTIYGLIPIEFKRTYNSVCSYDGPLGKGWMHNFDINIRIVSDNVNKFIIFKDEEGRDIEFDFIENNSQTINIQEKITLKRITDKTSYTIDDIFIIEKGKANLFFKKTSNVTNKFSLFKVKDKYNNVINLIYDNDGKLITIEDSVKRELSLVYNEYNKLERIFIKNSDNTFGLVGFLYDENNQLIESKYGENHHKYNYDNFNRLIQETDCNNHSFYFQYDENGYCIKTWGDENIFLRTFLYFPTENKTIVTDSNYRDIIYLYNDYGIVTKEIDEFGEKSYFYDENTNKIGEIDRSGNITRYVYDEDGNMTSVIDEMGDIQTFKYDENKKLATIVDEIGSEWRMEHQELFTKLLDPDNNEWLYEFYKNGLLQSIVDPYKKKTKFEYDGHGNLITIINRLGHKTKFEYDFLGRPICKIDAEGNITRIKWRRKNQITSVIYNDGSHADYYYDLEGNITGVKNSKLEINYGYGVGNRIDWINYNGINTIRFYYDKELRLVRIKDSLDRLWQLNRNNSGNIISEITFDGRKFFYRYDRNGRVSAKVDAFGNLTEVVRDKCGRIIKRKYPDDNVETFIYDARGYLIETRNDDCIVNYEYNKLGQRISESINEYKFEYKFDQLGNKIYRKFSHGAVLEFIYDHENHITSIKEFDNKLISIDYNSRGLENMKTFPGGVIHKRIYDRNNNLIELRLLQNDEILYNRKYNYESNILIKIDDNKLGYVNFEYDSVGRLIQIFDKNNINRENIKYDNVGNINGSPLEMKDSQIIENINKWNLKFDLNGNLIEKFNEKIKLSLFYNSANRLTEVYLNNNKIMKFLYDAEGRRIKKITEKREIDFMWEGEKISAEISNNNEYKEISEYIYYPNSFRPLLVINKRGNKFIECDQIGNPYIITDDDGSIIWRSSNNQYSYLDNLSNCPIPFGFLGQYHDIEIKLYYNRFRYYFHDLRMYGSPDPAGINGGFWPWNYVPRPNMQIDPFGLVDPWDIKFSQDTIDPFFQNTRDVPEKWRGKPISDAIEEARTLGRLPEGLELNAVRVVGPEGEQWVTLNNRTLHVARESGLAQVHPRDLGARGDNQLKKLLRDSDLSGPVDEVRVRPCK